MADAAQLQEEIESLKSENLILRAQVEWLQKQVFGGIEGEKLEDAQLVLKLGQMEKTAARLPRTVTSRSSAGRPRRPTRRREVLAHLPAVQR